MKFVNICTRRPNWNGCGWLNENPVNNFAPCHNQSNENRCPGCVRMTEAEAIEKGYMEEARKQ